MLKLSHVFYYQTVTTKSSPNFHCNHLMRQLEFLPLEKQVVTGPPHIFILPNMLNFLVYLHLIDMPLPVLFSMCVLVCVCVCVCASVSMCT